MIIMWELRPIVNLSDDLVFDGFSVTRIALSHRKRSYALKNEMEPIPHYELSRSDF
jgi:hypothetical protein